MILITDLFSILVLLIHIVTIIFPFPIYDSHNQTPVLHPGFVHQPERLVQVVVVQDLVKVLLFLFLPFFGVQDLVKVFIFLFFAHFLGSKIW